MRHGRRAATPHPSKLRCATSALPRVLTLWNGRPPAKPVRAANEPGDGGWPPQLLPQKGTSAVSGATVPCFSAVQTPLARIRVSCVVVDPADEFLCNLGCARQRFDKLYIDTGPDLQAGLSSCEPNEPPATRYPVPKAQPIVAIQVGQPCAYRRRLDREVSSPGLPGVIHPVTAIADLITPEIGAGRISRQQAPDDAGFFIAKRNRSGNRNRYAPSPGLRWRAVFAQITSANPNRLFGRVRDQTPTDARTGPRFLGFFGDQALQFVCCGKPVREHPPTDCDHPM